MTLRLNGSTSGYTEIDAPAVGGNNTLRLPTSNGAEGNVLQVDSTGQLQWRDGAFGTRNRIINGDMRISQRATTATGNYSSVFTYASVDRWAVYSANTSTTQAQSTDAPAGFQNSFKLQRPSGVTGTSLLAMSQAIESFNCNDLSNKNVTLSFWAKRGANFSGANLEVLAVTGTTADQGISAQDSWAGRQTPISPAAFAITTTWTQYSFTGVFGAGVQEAAIRFQFYPTGTAGADDSIYITGVQLEAGSVATPFERRSYGQELALCQRYYEFGHVCFMANATGGTAFGYQIPFVVQKRVSPTITYSGIVYNNANSISASRIYNYSFEPYANGTSTGWANFDADYAVSAEL